MDKSPDRIVGAFKRLDDANSATGIIRDKLITKLESAFDKFDFDITKSSPEERESAMTIINALDGLLKGKEKSALDNVKVSLSQRKEDDDHDRSELIADALKSLPALLQPNINDNIGDTERLAFDSSTIELDVPINKKELEITE